MKKAAFAFAAAILGGCGGSASTISGRVADGYIRGATVFWDCNGNESLDADEISTRTGVGGTYTIEEKSDNQSCSLIALVGLDAVDEDKPYQPIKSAYKMRAAPGLPQLITPFTTVVAGRISSGAESTTSSADINIAGALGLSGSVLTDYLQSSSSENIKKHALASFLVTGFQGAAAASITEISTQSYNNALSAVSQPSAPMSFRLGIQPFIFDVDSVGDTLRAVAAAAKTTNIVVRKTQLSDSVSNAVLDEIASGLTFNHAADYGIVDFEAIDLATLKHWASLIRSRRIGLENSQIAAALQKFSDNRQLLLAKASKDFNTTIADETALQNLFLSDPKATLDFVIEVADSWTSASLDIVSIATAGSTGKLSSAALKLVKSKGRVESIKNLAEKAHLSGSMIQCSADLVNISVDWTSAKPADLVTAISHCLAVVADVVSDLKKIKAAGSLSNAIKATNTLQVFTVDLVTDGSEDDKLVALIGVTTDLFYAFKDIASILDDPATATVLSFIDLPTQGLRAWATGIKLASAAGKVQDLAVTKAIQDFDAETAKIFKIYYAAYLSAFSGYFSVVDSEVGPYISSAAATTLTNGTFLVTANGSNIPPISLSATLGGVLCAETGVPAVRSRQFICPSFSGISADFIVLNGNIRLPSSILIALPQSP